MHKGELEALLFVELASGLKPLAYLRCGAVDPHIIKPCKAFSCDLRNRPHRVLNPSAIPPKMLSNDVDDQTNRWRNYEKNSRQLPIEVEHVGDKGNDREPLSQQGFQGV